MIYGGELMSNFGGSIKSKDSEMTKDIVFSEIRKILETNPSILIEGLNKSGISTPKNVSKKQLINLVVENLYSNNKFQKKISEIIANGHNDKYSNFDLGSLVEGGTDATKKTAEGAAGGGVVGAVAGAIGSIFGTVGKFKDAKTQKEADKQKLMLAILQGDEKKTNYVPIIIISSILIVGGIIAFVALKKK